MNGQGRSSRKLVPDFVLRLEATESGVVATLRSPNEPEAPIIHESKTANVRKSVEGWKSRFLSDPQGSGLITLGKELGSVAFPPPIRRSLLAEAAVNPIRIRLSTDELLWDVPWEVCSMQELAASNEGFVALSARMRIIRDLGQISSASGATEAATVLVAWANPGSKKYPQLHFAEKEAASVIRALRSPECGLQTDELPYASVSGLLRSLKEKQPSILHFIGHGDLNPSGGVIVLDGGQPGTDAAMYADELSKAVAGAGTSLVVLSGCMTSGAPQAIGTVLAKSGVPAVIAMSAPIQDSSAHQFARAMYSSLAEGTPLDEAVFEARCAIMGSGSAWAIPQLMLTSGEPIAFADADEQPFRWTGNEPRTNLAYDDRPFIGRVKERSDLRRKIRDLSQRLVTVTGPGGMGKTRLAKQVGAELEGDFPDGVWLIDCEALTGASELIGGIANCIPFCGGGDSIQRVKEAIARRRLLLILDCFEHSVSQGALISELVDAAPGLYVLLTSRILLGIPREFEYPLPPMSLSGKGGESSESIRLFAEAASHAIDGFTVSTKNRKQLRDLCESLEGVPLAIVLAAGRLRHMGLLDLIDQVQSQPIETLRRRSGGIDRHSNIESVVAASFALLPERERHMLCRFALFSGSFTLADAGVVCGSGEKELLAWISDLRDHSLIHLQRTEERTRYKLLDTVRDYVARIPMESEATRELQQCKVRHAEHYARLAVEIARLMAEGRWSAGTDQLMREIGNLRVAIATAAELKRDDLISAVAGSIGRRLFEAGLLTDFRKLTDAGYQAAARTGSTSLRIQLLGLDGALASRNGDEALCEKLWLERADLCRQIKDVEHCADTLIDLAWQAFERGDNYKSRYRLLEALRLARSVQDPIFVATARVVQARLAFAASNSRLAAHRARQAEAILPQCTDRSGALFLYQNLMLSCRELGQLEKSTEYTLELLRSAIERHQVVHAGWALLELGPLYEQTDRSDLAAKCYAAALKVHAEYQTRLKTRATAAYAQFKKKCQDPVAQSMLTSLRNRSWQEIVNGLTEI